MLYIHILCEYMAESLWRITWTVFKKPSKTHIFQILLCLCLMAELLITNGNNYCKVINAHQSWYCRKPQDLNITDLCLCVANGLRHYGLGLRVHLSHSCEPDDDDDDDVRNTLRQFLQIWHNHPLRINWLDVGGQKSHHQQTPVQCCKLYKAEIRTFYWLDVWQKMYQPLHW